MNGWTRSTIALTTGFLLAGCAASGSSRTTTAPDGVKADQARIMESIKTMDPQEDQSIAMAEMQALIKAGLYDPTNKQSLKVGEMAPDFELMPLRFYDFAIEQGIDKTNAGTLFEPVRLSAFRGSLPVVLIFGSYT